MRKFKQQFLAGPYLIWIIGFILLPLIMILYYAFTNGDGSFTLSYITAIADETNRKAMGLSLRLGIICTIVCLILSYPLAMILNNMKIKNNFSAGSKKDAFEIDTQAADKISVTGGYFTSDPSDYVPENAEPKLFVVASDKTGYAYMVTTTKPTEVDPIVTEKTETEVSESIELEDQKKIEAVIDNAQVSGVSDAVTESAQNAIINHAK